MKLLPFFILVISLAYCIPANAHYSSEESPMELLKVDSVKQHAIHQFNFYVDGLYADLNDTTLNKQLLVEGIMGYYNLLSENKVKRKDTLTLVDFSKPSSADRFYIIDLCGRKILHKSIVAHGVNSGRLYAKYFSNENNSRKSSLGFYLTTTTYSGKFDLALRIDGLERSNSHASSRGVVIHAAKYATYEFLEQNGGMLGRSYGCPALPFKKFDQIVEWIKGGSCVYIYHTSSYYKNKSKYLNQLDYLTNFV